MNLLILGADSLTGQALVHLALNEGIPCHALGTGDFLGLKKGELTKTLTRLMPSVIIYVATYSSVEKAEVDAECASQCDQVNSVGVSAVAELCAKLQVPLLFHSSSFVFDGAKSHPYLETDETNPRCRYGISKLAGERSIRELLPSHVILRTDWVFSRERPRYFEELLTALRVSAGKISVMTQRFSPTPAADVARVILAITKQADCGMDVWGTYHYCALQPMSKEFFVEHVLQEAAKYDPEIAALLPQLEILKLPPTTPWIGNSVLNTQHLFETFGIKQRGRAGEISALLQQICNYVPPQLPEEPVADEVETEVGLVKTDKPEIRNTKGSQAKRRLRKKSGSPRPAKKVDRQKE